MGNLRIGSGVVALILGSAGLAIGLPIDLLILHMLFLILWAIESKEEKV